LMLFNASSIGWVFTALFIRNSIYYVFEITEVLSKS